MLKRLGPWWPAILMGVGSLLLLGVNRQRPMVLSAPLTVVPPSILGYQGVDKPIGEEERRVAGMSAYLLRSYQRDSTFGFSVYVGYYEQQTQGRTIHSPRNCLPGAGWEPLSMRDEQLTIEGTRVQVRRYVLAKDKARALVYYWYQGRGRIASSEYGVKWDLLRDAALTGRSEEALVRVVVPLGDSEARADSMATGVAQAIIPQLDRALPAYPGRRLMALASPS
ncbi:MAG TPA: EpsI family protein [Gemmatimonadales bacterium]|nr:EpsI family protein [Gemmatimonadales bacterium]